MKPEEMLKLTEKLLDNMNKAKRKAVFVGFPSEKVGGQIYGDGRTLIENAAVHEYGSEDGTIPERSMLRVPFEVKKDNIASAMVQQWTAVAEKGRDVDTALGRFGVAAVNVVKQAFRTGGFGKWPELKPETIKRKGFSDILENTRVMRNSISWVVRKNGSN